MRMIDAPLVYLGPSLPLETAHALYPGCIVRPPIARGDLYRDRMLRGSVFLIVDGVFHQDQAISPREILDVLADGAVVAGAASMGALRAAECWPAGMRGVGSIYRLFRRGALDSDDEVAVAFDARGSSLALIDVRYAVWKAGLAREPAQRVVAAAAGMFYAERSWSAILRAAGVTDSADVQRLRVCATLKATDARRAIARVRRWIELEPNLLDRPRATKSGFVSSEERRERAADARAGLALEELESMRQLARWSVASGRYRRHAAALPPRLRAGDALAREPEAAAKLWKVLNEGGELEAELFRWRAQRTAAELARARSLVPGPLDRHVAEERIALEHGARSWSELSEGLADEAELRALVLEYARELAFALAAAR